VVAHFPDLLFVVDGGDGALDQRDIDFLVSTMGL
jgi:hypothetical protein